MSSKTNRTACSLSKKQFSSFFSYETSWLLSFSQLSFNFKTSIQLLRERNWKLFVYLDICIYTEFEFRLVFSFIKMGELSWFWLSPISFVLWRRKVPDRIVTKPHNSVIICDALCESQSCYDQKKKRKGNFSFAKNFRTEASHQPRPAFIMVGWKEVPVSMASKAIGL